MITYALECFSDTDDDTVLLARVSSSSVPRIGDLYLVSGKRVAGNRFEHGQFKVESVMWEVDLDEAPIATCRVLIVPDQESIPRLYCVCKDPRPDNGRCLSCGDTLPEGT